MDKRYQIFISSTYNDLIVERQKVIQAILKLYHFPIGMEMFHADNEEQWCQIKNTIDMSDYYVLIVGRYCGTLIEKEGISYTEKEYDYAISKGIPVLSFIISDKANKESYGVETNKQQKALKKFIKKIKELPCEFWNTPDELAFQVATTLSVKFRENNRSGWMPYNSYRMISLRNIESQLVGRYDVLYYAGLKGHKGKIIKSKLIIENNGQVIFYNNIKKSIEDAEYTYHGIYDAIENLLYIFLKNDCSNERAMICFTRFVGSQNRFIGLFTALSSNMIPVCIKTVCFREDFYNQGINEELLYEIITSHNDIFKNNMLAIEETKKHLFFSENIIKNKI